MSLRFDDLERLFFIQVCGKMGMNWGHDKLKAEVGKMFAAGGFVEASPEVRTESRVRWGVESLRTKGLEDGKTASGMWPDFVAKQLNGEGALDVSRALPTTMEWLTRLQEEGIVDLGATETDILSELLKGCFWESNSPRREKGVMYFRNVWDSAKARAPGDNNSLKRCLNHCTLADFINVVIDISVENLRIRLADYLTLFERQGGKTGPEDTLNSVAMMFKVSGSTTNRVRPGSTLPVSLRISNDIYRAEINMKFVCASEIGGKTSNVSASIAIEVNLAAHEMLRSLALTKTSPGYFDASLEDINKMEDIAFDVLLKYVDLDVVDESEDYSTVNKAVVFPMMCLAGVKPSYLRSQGSVEMWQSVMAGVFHHCARLGGIFQKLEQRYHFVECFEAAMKLSAYGSLRGDSVKVVIAVFAWLETKPERIVLSKPEEFMRQSGGIGVTHEMLDKTLGLSAQMIYVTTMLKTEGEPMDVTYAFMPLMSALNGMRGGRFRSRRIFPSGWLMYNLTRDIVWEEEDVKTMVMAAAFGVPEEEALIMLLGMTSLRDLTERMALVDDVCEAHIGKFITEAGLANITDTNAMAAASLMYRAAFEDLIPSNLWSTEDEDSAFVTKMSMNCMTKLLESANVGDISFKTAEAMVEELSSVGDKVKADEKMTADFEIKCQKVADRAKLAGKRVLNKFRKFKNAEEHPRVPEAKGRREKASLRLVENEAVSEMGAEENEPTCEGNDGEPKEQSRDSGTNRSVESSKPTYAEVVKDKDDVRDESRESDVDRKTAGERNRDAAEENPSLEEEGEKRDKSREGKQVEEKQENEAQKTKVEDGDKKHTEPREMERVLVEDASDEEDEGEEMSQEKSGSSIRTVMANREMAMQRATEVGRESVSSALVHPGGSPQTMADFGSITMAFPKKPDQVMEMTPVDTDRCVITKDGVIYPPMYSRATYKSGNQTLATCDAMSQVIAGVGGEKSTLVMGSATLLDSMGICFKAASTLDLTQFARNLKRFVGASKIAWGTSAFLRSDEVLKIDGARLAIEVAKQVKEDIDALERAESSAQSQDSRLNKSMVEGASEEKEGEQRYWRFDNWDRYSSIDLLNREEVEGQKEWMKAIVEKTESFGKKEFTTKEAIRLCAAAREMARFYPIKKQADIDTAWDKAVFESMILKAAFTSDDFKSCMDAETLLCGGAIAASNSEDAKLCKAAHEEMKLRKRLLAETEEEIVEEEAEVDRERELEEIAKELELQDTSLRPIIIGVVQALERFSASVAEGMVALAVESDLPLRTDSVSGSLMVGTKIRTITTYGLLEIPMMVMKETECLTAALVNAVMETIIRVSGKVKIEMESKEGRISFIVGFPFYLICEGLKALQVVYNLTARLTNSMSQWTYQMLVATRRLDEGYRSEYISAMIVEAVKQNRIRTVKTLEIISGARMTEEENEVFGNLAEAERKLEEDKRSFRKVAGMMVKKVGMVIGLPFVISDFCLAAVASRALRLGFWFVRTVSSAREKISRTASAAAAWTLDKIGKIKSSQVKILGNVSSLLRRALELMSVISKIYDIEVREEFKLGSKIGEAGKVQTSMLSNMVNKITSSVVRELADKIISQKSLQDSGKKMEEEKKKETEIREKRSAYAMLSNKSCQIETDAEAEVWRNVECKGRATCFDKTLLMIHAPILAESDVETAKKQKMILLGDEGVTFCVMRAGTQIVSPKVGRAGAKRVESNKTKYVLMDKGLLRVSSVDINGRHTRGTATLLFNITKETEELFTVEHLRGCGGAFKIGELRDEVICLCVNHKNYDLDLAEHDTWDADEAGLEAPKNLKLKADSIVSSVSDDYVFAICSVGDYRGASGAAVQDSDGGFVGINLAQVTLDGKDRIPSINRSAVIVGINMEEEAPLVSLPHQTIVDCPKCMLGQEDECRKAGEKEEEKEKEEEDERNSGRKIEDETKHEETTVGRSFRSLFGFKERKDNEIEIKDDSDLKSTGALAVVCEKTAASKAEVAGTFSLKIAYNVVGEMMRDSNSMGLRDRSMLLLKELEQAMINNRSLVICCDSNAAETTIAAWLSCLRMPFRRATHMGVVHGLAAESDENFTFSCVIISAETIVTDFVRGGRLVTYRRDRTCKAVVLMRPDGFKPDVIATVYGFAYGLTENVLTIPLGAKDEGSQAGGTGVWIKTDDKSRRKNQGTNNVHSLVRLLPSGKKQMKDLTDVDAKVFVLTTEVHSTYMHKLREEFASEHSISVMNVAVGNAAVLSGSAGLTNLAAADLLAVSSATFENTRQGEERLACVWDRTMSDCETELLTDALRMAAVLNDLNDRFKIAYLYSSEFSPRAPMGIENPERIKMKRKNRIAGEDVGRDELFKRLADCRTRGCSYMMDPSTIISKLTDRMKNPSIASTMLSKEEVLTGEALKVTEMDQGWFWALKLKINDANGAVGSKLATVIRWISRKIVGVRRLLNRTIVRRAVELKDKAVRIVRKASRTMRRTWDLLIGRNAAKYPVAKKNETEEKTDEKSGKSAKAAARKKGGSDEELKQEGSEEKKKEEKRAIGKNKGTEASICASSKKISWADQCEGELAEEGSVEGEADKKQTGDPGRIGSGIFELIGIVARSVMTAIRTGVKLALIGPKIALFAVGKVLSDCRSKVTESLSRATQVMRLGLKMLQKLRSQVRSRVGEKILSKAKSVACAKAGKKNTAKEEGEAIKKNRNGPMEQVARAALDEMKKGARKFVSRMFSELRRLASSAEERIEKFFSSISRAWSRLSKEVKDLYFQTNLLVRAMMGKKMDVGKHFCLFRKGETSSADLIISVSRAIMGLLGRIVIFCVSTDSYTVEALSVSAFSSVAMEPIAYLLRNSDWILPNIIMWMSDYVSYTACIGEVGMWVAGKVALVKLGKRTIAVGALYDAAASLASASTARMDVQRMHANVAERIQVGKRSTSIVVMNDGPIWAIAYAMGNAFVSMVNILKKGAFSYKLKRMMVWIMDNIKGRSQTRGATGVVKMVPLYSIYDGVGIFSFISAAIVAAAAIANRMADEDAAVIGVLSERKHTADNINVYMENREAYNIALRASAIGVASYAAYCATTMSILASVGVSSLVLIDWILAARNRTGYVISIAHALIRFAAYPWPLAMLDAVNLIALDNEDCAPSSISMMVSTGKVASEKEFDKITERMIKESMKFMVRETEALRILTDLDLEAAEAVKASRKKLMIEHEIEDFIVDRKWKLNHEDRNMILSYRGQDIGISKTEEEKTEGHRSLGALEFLFKNQMRYVGRMTFLEKREQEDDREIRAEMSRQQSRLLLSEDLWKGIVKRGSENDFDAARDARQDVLFALAERNDCPVNRKPDEEAVRGFCQKIVSSIFVGLKAGARMNMPVSGLDWAVIAADANDKATSGIIDRHRSGLPLIASYLPRKIRRVKAVRDMLIDGKAKGGEVAANVFAKRRVEKKKTSRLTGEKIVITRTIQAHETEMKMVELSLFSVMDKMLKMMRFRNNMSLGINHFGEFAEDDVVQMAAIAEERERHNKVKAWRVSLDHSSYDAQQRLWAIEAVRIMREKIIEETCENKATGKSLVALMRRIYETNRLRPFLTPSGDLLYVCGQQMTGHATTSSDNSMRALGYVGGAAAMAEKKHVKIVDKSVRVQGDDTVFGVVAPKDLDKERIKNILIESFERSGMVLKTDKINVAAAYSSCDFLSHWCEEAHVVVEYEGDFTMNRTLWRPIRKRSDIAEMLPTSLRSAVSGKQVSQASLLASKALSFTYMYGAFGDVVVYCVVAFFAAMATIKRVSKLGPKSIKKIKDNLPWLVTHGGELTKIKCDMEDVVRLHEMTAKTAASKFKGWRISMGVDELEMMRKTALMVHNILEMFPRMARNERDPLMRMNKWIGNAILKKSVFLEIEVIDELIKAQGQVEIEIAESSITYEPWSMFKWANMLFYPETEPEKIVIVDESTDVLVSAKGKAVVEIVRGLEEFRTEEIKECGAILFKAGGLEIRLIVDCLVLAVGERRWIVTRNQEVIEKSDLKREKKVSVITTKPSEAISEANKIVARLNKKISKKRLMEALAGGEIAVVALSELMSTLGMIPIDEALTAEACGSTSPIEWGKEGRERIMSERIETLREAASEPSARTTTLFVEER